MLVELIQYEANLEESLQPHKRERERTRRDRLVSNSYRYNSDEGNSHRISYTFSTTYKGIIKVSCKRLWLNT